MLVHVPASIPPLFGTCQAARGPVGPAPGPSRALERPETVRSLPHPLISCRSGGSNSSPLSHLSVLHRSSVRGLVAREGADEADRDGRCASRQPRTL